MGDAPGLALALVGLAATLAAAVRRSPRAPDWLVAAIGALVLLAVGAIGPRRAGDVATELGPTLGFLVALLLLGEGCRREGLFAALGDRLAARSRGDATRLLAGTFLAAAAVTAVLSLDATVVLLTPVVLAAARRVRVPVRPPAYASVHLANAASLPLPVSNLTNLLAFGASGLSFTRFAGLMVLPWLVVLAVEWVVLRRVLAGDLPAAPPRSPELPTPRPAPRRALAILALTLVGLGISGPLGVEPVWAAAAGALALSGPALLARTTTAATLIRAAQPGLLVVVLGLGIIVEAAGEHGLRELADALLPEGAGLPALLAVAAVSALAANVLNNLPATLLLVPLAAAAGPAALLAMLIGVNVGPNLTPTGSLATLLWRRVLKAEGEHLGGTRELVGLGLATTPAALVLATIALWASAEVLL